MANTKNAQVSALALSNVIAQAVAQALAPKTENAPDTKSGRVLKSKAKAVEVDQTETKVNPNAITAGMDKRLRKSGELTSVIDQTIADIRKLAAIQLKSSHAPTKSAAEKLVAFCDECAEYHCTQVEIKQALRLAYRLYV